MALTPEQWEERIGRRVRLRDLHVLLSVTQLGSMAKAAKALAISQPAISKSIADLEQALGVRLLDRGPSGVQATAYGAALVRRGLASFDELRQGVAEIQCLAGTLAGEVRVGCNDSLTVSLLPSAVEALAAAHPDVQVHISHASRPISAEINELRDRNLDVIVGRGLFPEADLDEEVLFHERLIVVTGTHTKWAGRHSIELGELMDEKWILHSPREAPGSLVREAFQAHGLELPKRGLVSVSFHLRQVLLTTGEYITVVPESLVRVFNATGKTISILPVDLGIDARPVALFTLKNRTLSPVVEVFLRAVRLAAAPLK